jgi:hypothetical protein
MGQGGFAKSRVYFIIIYQGRHKSKSKTNKTHAQKKQTK